MGSVSRGDSEPLRERITGVIAKFVRYEYNVAHVRAFILGLRSEVQGRPSYQLIWVVGKGQ